MHKKIILIGGTPTAGKSYLTRRLAASLSLPWISADTIREMMTRIVSPEKFPNLTLMQKYTAEEYYKKFDIDQVVQHQIMEATETWTGVQALIDTDYVWGSFIVEGVAILPELTYNSYAHNPAIKPLFLVITNKDRIKEIAHSRGLWGDPNNYPHELKDKEVEWAYKFSLWMKAEAEKYGYPVYEIKQLDFPLSELDEFIN